MLEEELNNGESGGGDNDDRMLLLDDEVEIHTTLNIHLTPQVNDDIYSIPSTVVVAPTIANLIKSW